MHNDDISPDARKENFHYMQPKDSKPQPKLDFLLEQAVYIYSYRPEYNSKTCIGNKAISLQ